MNRSLKKIWNVISSILVALVVILALLLVGARVVGLQVFTVLSGSMEPDLLHRFADLCKRGRPLHHRGRTAHHLHAGREHCGYPPCRGHRPDEEDPTVIRFRTKGDAQ